METKKFTFWLQSSLRTRAEKLGYKITRFIVEAMVEKLAREEALPELNPEKETIEEYGTRVHETINQKINIDPEYPIH